MVNAKDNEPTGFPPQRIRRAAVYRYLAMLPVVAALAIWVGLQGLIIFWLFWVLLLLWGAFLFLPLVLDSQPRLWMEHGFLCFRSQLGRIIRVPMHQIERVHFTDWGHGRHSLIVLRAEARTDPEAITVRRIWPLVDKYHIRGRKVLPLWDCFEMPLERLAETIAALAAVPLLHGFAKPENSR